MDQPARLPFAPIFVMGVPRSGTTWIQDILASHPEAAALRETYIFSRSQGLGALLRGVRAGRTGPEGPAGLGRLFSRDELVSEIRRIATRWMGEAADGRRFVVEKSPWHLTETSLIAEVLPEARFVHVLRDGRDVTVSLRAARRSWSSPAGMISVSDCAGTWVRGVEAARRAGEELGDRFLEVRFEETKSDALATSARLFDFCEMDHDEDLLAAVVERTEFERRRRGGEDQFYRGGRVGDWRERFGLAQARAFHRVAWEALLATGYERDPRWWLRRRLRSREP